MTIPDLYSNDSPEQICLWAQQAFAQITAAGLVPTPEVFAVFYCRHAGKLPELTQDLERTLADAPDIVRVVGLYHKHLGFEREREILTAANTAVEGELARVLSLLDDANSGASRYRASLDDFSGNLRQPLSIDQLRETVTRVANETRVMAEQNQQLQQQLSASSQQMAELRTNLDRVKRESLIDPLTEVGNRKHFNNELARTTADADAQPLCLLMVDIDFFKKFNDNHGHQVGDQVLRLVGRVLMDNIKGRDIVARYGGEEFAILLPNTRLADAVKVADHLRRSVGEKKIMRRPTNVSLGSITLSIGVTQLVFGEVATQFIERADRALYRAKGEGRNRVLAEEPPAAA